MLIGNEKRKWEIGKWEMRETIYSVLSSSSSSSSSLSISVICLQVHFAFMEWRLGSMDLLHRYRSSRGVRGDIQGDTRRILSNETVTDQSLALIGSKLWDNPRL